MSEPVQYTDKDLALIAGWFLSQLRYQWFDLGTNSRRAESLKRLLLAVYMADREGKPLSLKQAGVSSKSVDGRTIRKHLRWAQQNGYVELGPDTSDKRVTRVVSTEKLRAKAEQELYIFGESVKEVSKHLSIPYWIDPSTGEKRRIRVAAPSIKYLMHQKGKSE